MAFTTSEHDALKSAIATGTRKVRYESGGEVREVTYRSLAEMQTVLGQMERELGLSSASRTVLASHCRDR